ncbi:MULTISPECIES: PPK2 family polyphosphate kinase [Aerococcus]|uniref:PPK2 family polyphosphate kinase n=2 Tax=Aerococcus TaxID=1375 RepID=A0A1E9PEE0_9LACT|nr:MULTISPECIES: PPK2 family polyphosphate kinase [Aerococcus]KAA9239229.1 polyphosphate--nucleotide phosphotransferase [Aerococcus urinae]KAA9290771.1 polyphosphate--nucleotide phosphotransferase [Aerococcus mictus]KAA9298396.1 polyphosphate--nucleotide phosphotransferase [Aerococcus tenax]MCY3034134.1 polyphosphate--nucleotide phosphotransferase [Aerococcus mictus]MCY3063905.1 polyphosphate--nucleotide phosphotransferase [Aerococcus mictus]
MEFKDFKVTDGKFSLADFQTAYLSDAEDEKLKEEIYESLVPQLVDWHDRLTAEGTHGLLVALQALDAAGKDELIRYIFSTLQPQALKVTSYQQPSDNEIAHDYLWRMHEGMPERGTIAILNRSYYEDIIAPQVHNSLDSDDQPSEIRNDPQVVEKRYQQILQFEKYLCENGFPVVKFFFHMSKDKQRERLLERIEEREKNHEFSFSDIEDRKKWDLYQEVFEKMLQNTACDYAPWYILPADNPWLARKIATQALIEVIEKIDPHYPTFSDEEQEKASQIVEQLRNNEI